MTLEYARGTPILLKNYPHLRESWLRDRIADDPNLLGLGPLRLVDIERRHARAGRLDLLLQRGPRRYVVEIMLGRLDESHLVRAIEYWDAEQRASPGLEHVAVLAAEELPPRLLRVLELLRGTLPLIVLQMCATQWENKFVLHFVRLLEGPGRPEKAPPEPEGGGETLWEDKWAAPARAALSECLGLLREVLPCLHLEYRRHSLAVRSQAQAPPLLVLYPKRHFLRVEIQAAEASRLWERCPAACWQALEAGQMLHAVELLLFPGELARKGEALEQALRAAQHEAQAAVSDSVAAETR
ncbi:MAG TPA: hypothetical protein VLT85_05205 [Terriglobales bacterium]|nr:hypothetical protein [Terriglobales bacterium]